MAIRMKEWGMMEYPGRAPQLSVHGISDWGNSMSKMGQAVAGFLENTGHFVHERMKVTSTGNLADFAGKLKEIEQATREELSMQPIRDWDYAWEQTSAPMLESVINEMPEETRDAARDMAALYIRRASLQARRDYELENIGRARSQWQNRVDSAVEEGDDLGAGQWLEAGRDVFVPESEMEGQQQRVRSKCSMKRWQNGLNDAPMETLLAMQQQPQDWPSDEADASQLQEQAAETQKRLTLQLAQELADRVEQGHAPTPEELQPFVSVGLLSELPQNQEERPLAISAACDWLRRIDEREDDAAQEAALKMEIATAPIPLEERQMLLSRLRESAAVPAEKRRDFSQRLWNAYRAGAFGCCGDEEALRRLGELQEKGLNTMLQQENRSEPPLSLTAEQDHWVCFESE